MRLQLTRRTDLATRALLLLADGARHKAAALAGDLDTTPGFLAQALTPLVAEGWLSSVSGPSGGYRLEADLGTLSVLEVVEAVDGPTDTVTCVLEGRTCGAAHPCALHHAWTRARAQLLADLADTTLTDVADRA